ncbi:MAG: glycosyltransferase [Alphaproteobacteria bacterium]|nr:glycosyltransferase [Alphaproteobacteria bacterium]
MTDARPTPAPSNASDADDRRADQGRARRRPVELAVVVPTYNERDNIQPLYELLCAALGDVQWEMVVVDDDSPDGTAALIRDMSQKNANVRVLQRLGRRGLSTAVIEGMLATSAQYLAVIDADMQHDETKLAEMLRILRSGEVDIAVGSRFVDGGGVGDWAADRVQMSRIATRVAKLVLKSDLSDPMSGFFMIRRDAFEEAMRNLSGEGYKILLDIFASSKTPLRFREVPYRFRNRVHGESKVDTLVLWEYLALIVDKLFGKYVPARLILFSMIGASGVVVHFAAFSLSFFAASLSFLAAQTIATFVAMTTNYTINNILTYRDKRRKGASFVTGLLAFYLICGIGVVGNVGVSNALYNRDVKWWLATIAGIAIGVIWNYSASSIFIWDKKR